MTVARPQSAEQGRLLSLPCANPRVKARDELVTVDYSTGLGGSLCGWELLIPRALHSVGASAGGRGKWKK